MAGDLTAVREAIAAVVGDANVKTGPSELDLHAGDLSFHPPHRPDIVVYPGSTWRFATPATTARRPSM